MARLTKQRIVSAARCAVDDGGHERVALRGLARDLGVTAPALYDHFASKDELLRSVAEEGFVALAEVTRVGGDTAIERLRQRALAYVSFASLHPELFRLMFLYRPAGIEVVDPSGLPANNELGAATIAYEQGLIDIALAVEAGDLLDADINETAIALWAAIHGVATIALTAPELAESTAERVVDTMLAGLSPRQ